MSSVEHLDAPISEHPSPGAATDEIDHDGNAISLRLRTAGSSFFWGMQLLSHQRRKAMTRFSPSAAKSMTSLPALHRTN